MRGRKASPEASELSETLKDWRVARLRERGFEPALAENIAGDGRYDLHALLELRDRGCPAHLAARILAPLESEL